MTPQEKIELVQNTIKNGLKDCPFTFDDMRIELDTGSMSRDYYYEPKIKVTFIFNEYGNCQQTLGNEHSFKLP